MSSGQEVKKQSKFTVLPTDEKERELVLEQKRKEKMEKKQRLMQENAENGKKLWYKEKPQKQEEGDFEWKDEKHIYEEIKGLFIIEQEEQEQQKKEGNDDTMLISKEEQEQLNFVSQNKFQHMQNIVQNQNIGINEFSETDTAKFTLSGFVQEIRNHGRQYKFVQLSDYDNIVQIQVIIKKKFWKGQHGYMDMCSLVQLNTAVSVEGYIGVSSFGKVSLFAYDIKILDLPPPQQQELMAITVFHYIKMYEVGIISLNFLLRLLHCKKELIEKLQNEGRELLDKYDYTKGMVKHFRGNKKSKQYKILLEVVSKTIQGIPLGLSRQREPKVAQEYHNLLTEYEDKYLSTYEVSYVDHGISVDNAYGIIFAQQNEQSSLQMQQQFELQKENLKAELQNSEGNEIILKKNQLDLLQFIPDQQDEMRVKYIENRKKPQVLWFLKQLHTLNFLEQGSLHLLDIGGGRGDLALSIAKEFKNCFVTVIDINEKSLNQGREIAKENGILNINFKQCGVQDLEKQQHDILAEKNKIIQEIQEGDQKEEYKQLVQQDSFDFVVGLHPCGGLGDALLEFCIYKKCHFLVCTCCFFSNFFLVPELFLKAEKEVYEKEQDKQDICKHAELHGLYPIAERSMQMVNLLRLNIIDRLTEEGSYDSKILRFSSNFSVKNFVLQGIYSKKKKEKIIQKQIIQQEKLNQQEYSKEVEEEEDLEEEKDGEENDKQEQI